MLGEEIVIDDWNPPDGWRDLDLSIPEEHRGAVPAFPLGLLPQVWAEWVGDTASSTGAPTDYVAQTVLAAVAAVCGAGVRIQATPAWREPMVLWQAMVGGPSTGKSGALAPMRRLLGTLEGERRARDDDERRERHAERVRSAGLKTPFMPSQIVVEEGDLASVAACISGNPRGVILWRDVDGSCLPAARGAEQRRAWLQGWSAEAVTAPHALDCLAVSVLATLRPDALAEAMEGTDAAVASRLLYAWPATQPYRSLIASRIAADAAVLGALRRLSRLARRPEDPVALPVDQHGLKALDVFLAGLHAERTKAEGLEAAWLGKGPAMIVRLAGALELLAWSTIDALGPPGHLGQEQIERAASLWADYFRPHARAVFDKAMPSDYHRRVRRAAKWLRDSGETVVSREDIRRKALCQTVNADEAHNVLLELDRLGYVRRAKRPDRAGAGRHAVRWEVNPALKEG